VSSESCNIWLWLSKAVVCLLLEALVAPAADGDAIARGFEVTSIGSTGPFGGCERDMPVKLFEGKAGTRMLCMAQWRDAQFPKSSFHKSVIGEKSRFASLGKIKSGSGEQTADRYWAEELLQRAREGWMQSY